jgi:hypothetical protein
MAKITNRSNPQPSQRAILDPTIATTVDLTIVVMTADMMTGAMIGDMTIVEMIEDTMTGDLMIVVMTADMMTAAMIADMTTAATIADTMTADMTTAKNLPTIADCRRPLVPKGNRPVPDLSLPEARLGCLA